MNPTAIGIAALAVLAALVVDSYLNISNALNV
jgi:hypothetical protein